jgi:hypothetical protein
MRALLVEAADVHADDGEADAPASLSLASARLRSHDVRAKVIVTAAAPRSSRTQALFSAGAEERAVELLRIGWLLARRVQSCVADATLLDIAFRDLLLGHVMLHAIERVEHHQKFQTHDSSVQ